MKLHYSLSFLCLLLLSCGQKNDYLLSKVPAEHSQVFFSNNIVENQQYNVFDYHNLYNGGGVAALDVNQDGLVDLFFSGNQVNDKLYLNQGNFKFQDISQLAGIESTGWSTGIAITDINGDGLADIYVCKAGNETATNRANKFFINQGDFRFKDEALERGLADTSHSSQAAFFDYDHDGDLDMYLLTTSNLIRNPNLLRKPGQYGDYALDKLFQNDGTGYFNEVGKAAGILKNTHGLGLAISDINNDGWEDILASSDFLPNDALYINNQDGTFSEKGAETFAYQSRFSMGNDIADYDNDGLMDIVTTDMLPADNTQQKKMLMTSYHVFETERYFGYQPQFTRNMLHRNLGKDSGGQTHFSEIGQYQKIHASDWSWAPLFYDLNNDGLKDLSITNGYLRDIIDADYVSYNLSFAERTQTPEEMRVFMNENALNLPFLKKKNKFYKNTGGQFLNVSEEWLENEDSFSNGAVYADLDNDGDLDYVVNNVNQSPSLFRNNAKNNFLKIKLNGPVLNPFGQGARLELTIDGKKQTHFQSLSRGYLSSQDQAIIFGCKGAKKVDELIIYWSGGKTQTLVDISVNQIIELSESDAREKPHIAINEKKTLFKETPVNYRHEESRFIDFYRENLLLRKYSEPGPALTSGDVNGDGLDDFFISGSAIKSGTFFMQKNDGDFAQNQEWEAQIAEDADALFFDADADQDLDLYLLSGSNEFPIGSEENQDRLYLNNGKGKFADVTAGNLPEIRIPGSVIVSLDIDKDGDQDLFRGGAVIPGQFPQATESFLLLNDSGQFRAESLGPLGLLSDAQAADLNQDGWEDLIVVGEFMAPKIFINRKGRLELQPAIEGLKGLWNCLEVRDLDKDGDLDVVIGNMGKNYRYAFSAEEPLRIYLADLNEDGQTDVLPAYFLSGKEFPIPNRDDLIRQYPKLRSKFPNYTRYAEAEINALIDTEDTDYIEAELMESIVLRNDGTGQFTWESLPVEAQQFPIQSIIINDFNRDGHADLLMAGNDMAIEPSNAGFVNGSRSLLLKGDGERFKKGLSNVESGIWLEAETKDMLLLKNGTVVAAQNNAALKIFVLNQ